MKFPDIPDIDLICAGWPCQNNSIAGKREGLKGEKSGLFKEFCRVLRVFSPRWFIGENVPGLLFVNAGKDFCQVLSEFQDIGYGVSWRILDSQYFGVAQQRRRLFIVGRFGEPCPPEILFERKGNTGNHPPVAEVGQVGLCISTRDGQRQDPGTENIVAFCLGTDLRGQPYKLHTETLIAGTITAKETQMSSGTACGKRNLIARTILSSDTKLRKLSSDSGNIIASQTNTNGKREASGIPYELHITNRGVLIGNAVTVNVAKWIGERIVRYEAKSKEVSNG